MSLNCGIVGLPNVGKSTLFSAMTSAPAEAANYPFCTIDPNVGIVSVPDRRLSKISERIPAEKVIPAVVEFVDIAGLVKGASEGEGLGNKFLSHVREVGVIVHVVRCFEEPDVVHVDGKLDPPSDIQTINIELALKDLDSVEKRLEKNERSLKSAAKDQKKAAENEQKVLEALQSGLSQGTQVRQLEFSDEQRKIVNDLHLLTAKKQIYVCNIDESALHEDNEYTTAVKSAAAGEEAAVLNVCGKLEAEIASLETREEKDEFLADAGLSESGLSKLIHTGYDLLGLRTFFTAGPKEDRAWTFHNGDTAPMAAGVIHTDFEKGFIKAEVYHCDDLFEHGSEQAVKAAGKMRIEGKEYIVKDGDIMHFRFNV